MVKTQEVFHTLMHMKHFTVQTSSINIRKENIRIALYFGERYLFSLSVFLSAGYSNTGTNPESALTKIRHLLGYNSTSSHDQTDETMLGIIIIMKKRNDFIKSYNTPNFSYSTVELLSLSLHQNYHTCKAKF